MVDIRDAARGSTLYISYDRASSPTSTARRLCILTFPGELVRSDWSSMLSRTWILLDGEGESIGWNRVENYNVRHQWRWPFVTSQGPLVAVPVIAPSGHLIFDPQILHTRSYPLHFLGIKNVRTSSRHPPGREAFLRPLVATPIKKKPFLAKFLVPWMHALPRFLSYESSSLFR